MGQWTAVTSSAQFLALNLLSISPLCHQLICHIKICPGILGWLLGKVGSGLGLFWSHDLWLVFKANRNVETKVLFKLYLKLKLNVLNFFKKCALNFVKLAKLKDTTWSMLLLNALRPPFPDRNVHQSLDIVVTFKTICIFMFTVLLVLVAAVPHNHRNQFSSPLSHVLSYFLYLVSDQRSLWGVGWVSIMVF